MNSSEPDQSSGIQPAALRGAGLILRLVLLAVVMGGIAGLFLWAGGWFSPHALSPAKIIDTFEEQNGTHPGFRRNHAKGVGASGYFESNGRGTALSKAAVFLPGRVPVIARFAFAGGQPYVADAPQIVRSLAVLFKLPDGEEWRIAAINIPVFPVNTPQGFYELLVASAPDPATGKPDPAKMAVLLSRHPETAKALTLIRGNPVSSGFDNTIYNGLNAFRFINRDGAVVPIRWSMVPAQPFEAISTNQPEKSATNYLFDALIAGVHAKPLQWHLIITVGQAEDSASDATVPWPPERQQVDVGMLVIEHIESEETSPARDINFDPLILPDGIRASDDPLLSARSAAYSQSFTRREGESKEPSAVSAAETGK
jgi:catalase